MDGAAASVERKTPSGTDLEDGATKTHGNGEGISGKGEEIEEHRDQVEDARKKMDAEADGDEKRREGIAEKASNMKTEDEGVEEQSDVQESSKKGDHSKEEKSQGDQTPPVAPSSSGTEGIPSMVVDEKGSESEVVQSSALSNTENDSTAATDQDKSKDSPVPQIPRPEASEKGGSQVEEREKERPVTDPNSVKKKRKDRKTKRRSRHSSETGVSVPRLRKRSSRVEDSSSRQSTTTGTGGKRCLEAIILSIFQNLDPGNTGFVEPLTFWKVLQSTLALQSDEVAALQATVVPDRSGLIPYMEFATQATEMIATLYISQSPAERHWVELQTSDGSFVINYNKQTGEAMDKTHTGDDFFSGIIEDLYRQADKDGRGYISWEMFFQLLQSAEMAPYLQEQDFQDMYEYYANFQDGNASYSEFATLAKEVILRVYRAKDPSESPWCKISGQEVGEVWLNKFTGETHQGVQTGEREQEIAFISQAYAHVEQTNFELEQYKQLNRQLENQLAVASEEQETLETQLYETGHALDQANAEIIEKENEVEQMKAVITSRDQQMEVLGGTMTELETIRKRLQEAERELQSARETIAKRDSSITKRDANIMTMQKKEENVADTLKNARGEMDARDSTISTLKHQLHMEQKKLKDYEELVPELEEKLSSTKEQLNTTRHSLEEKTAALLLTRKHLRTARDKNMEMDKDMEKLGQTQEKLRSMDSEIRTLKTFLTTKTALIEKHKKEVREEKLRVAELEEKDQRRAVILADVLEKTARQYQQQIRGTAPRTSLSPRGKRYHQAESQVDMEEPRPYSAPAIPPEGAQVTETTDFSTPRVAKAFTVDAQGPVLLRSNAVPPSHPDHRRVRLGDVHGGKTRTRSRTVPRLPQIRVAGSNQRNKAFVFPTSHDLTRIHRLRDAALLDHTPSNPYCTCELCRMNATVVGHASQHRPETGLTGMTPKTAGLHGYQGETDVREVALSHQLHIGQRVVVRMKKSEFDLEPTKLTGVVRYVGKIDSEYVDHRFYVGVKLDEAVGDTDGLIKNKRYFTCPPKHGKLVRISNVVAVLPNKDVEYKPLHDISKRSPYMIAQKNQKKSPAVSVS